MQNLPPETPLTADGFDKAIVGTCAATGRIIYSVEKMLRILEREMSPEEAYEYFDFNILGAYMGEGTPIYMYKI